MLSLLNTTFTTAVRRGVTVIGTLLSALKARSTYFENKSGTKTILQELEDDGLLSKASIVLTPTAYDVGRLNSVKTYTGDELVTNGDFSEAGVGNIISASGGILVNQNNQLKITSNGSSGFSRGVYNLTETHTYKIKADVISVTGAVRFINVSDNAGDTNLVAGTTFEKIVRLNGTIGAAQVGFGGLNDTGFELVLDNISIIDVSSDFDFVRSSTATRVNASSQIESVATNTPRIDYSDGVGKILLEFTGTNLATNSNSYQAWSANSSTTPTPNDNAGVAPDGTTTAWQFDVNSNTIRMQENYNTGIGNDVTMSFFIKSSSGEKTNFRLYVNTMSSNNVYFNGTDKTVRKTADDAIDTDYSVLQLANDWCRVSRTVKNTTDQTSIFILFPFYESTLTRAYIWGAQVEQQSYMTSYIPTGSTTVTRVVDRANSSGNSTLINSVQGTIYFELSMFDTGTNDFMFLSQPGATGSTNSIGVYGNNGGGITGQIKHAGGTTYIPISTGTGAKLINTKFALRWGGGTIESYFEGTETATRSIPNGDYSAGDLTAFNFSEGSSPIKGNIKCMAIFPEALTDTELQNLTS